MIDPEGAEGPLFRKILTPSQELAVIAATHFQVDEDLKMWGPRAYYAVREHKQPPTLGVPETLWGIVRYQSPEDKEGAWVLVDWKTLKIKGFSVIRVARGSKP